MSRCIETLASDSNSNERTSGNIPNISFIKLNYTNLSLNNFITTFEFMEENNDVGNESFLSNKTSYNFDDTNSISFGTRKNKETNVTEYYNLIYEYKNDCLVAGIEYNKNYYSDVSLRPEEEIFFSVTIMPFGKVNSINVKDD